LRRQLGLEILGDGQETRRQFDAVFSHGHNHRVLNLKPSCIGIILNSFDIGNACSRQILKKEGPFYDSGDSDRRFPEEMDTLTTFPAKD
jgi:hypothetical protein